MAVFVDLVPNHSAVDAYLMQQRIDFYIKAPRDSGPPFDESQYLPNGVAYGKDPYSGCWTDTAQYNIFENNMRKKELEYLDTIAQIADGCRCDMAMLELNRIFNSTWYEQLTSWGYSVPDTEFWNDATTTVKESYPNFLFMGEVYW